MKTSYESLENEKNKEIPEDVAGWVGNPRSTIYNMLARLAYRVAGLQFEFITKDDIDSMFGGSKSILYYGSAATTPVAADILVASQKEFDGEATVEVNTTSSQQKKCHFVAVDKDVNASVVSWVDSQGTSYADLVETIEVGNYKVFAYVETSAYIETKSTIKVKIG